MIRAIVVTHLTVYKGTCEIHFIITPIAHSIMIGKN